MLSQQLQVALDAHAASELRAKAAKRMGDASLMSSEAAAAAAAEARLRAAEAAYEEKAAASAALQQQMRETLARVRRRGWGRGWVAGWMTGVQQNGRSPCCGLPRLCHSADRGGRR